MSVALRVTGARVLWPDGLAEHPVSIRDGMICPSGGREVDLTGYMILPGMVDPHGDGFERHVAPRRGAMKAMTEGIIATEAELAANGITTATLAQFLSWEGGMRGAEFAENVFTSISKARNQVVTELMTQLRFEISMLDHYDAVLDLIDRHQIDYVVFNDHLPHEALSQGKRPKRLTGQALKAGQNPEKYLAYMQTLHSRFEQVPQALDVLCARLAARGVHMGSHDDRTRSERALWAARGVTIAEFPETLEAAETAFESGSSVVMGAPNIVRGGSHNGNASAIELVAMGYVTSLASDYHYPSLRRAAFLLADSGICDLVSAWRLVSSGPAEMLGLRDRGHIRDGLRADLLVLDARTRRVAGTLVRGRFSYLSGDLATRLIG